MIIHDNDKRFIFFYHENRVKKETLAMAKKILLKSGSKYELFVQKFNFWVYFCSPASESDSNFKSRLKFHRKELFSEYF